jgi:hypothetical protein
VEVELVKVRDDITFQTSKPIESYKTIKFLKDTLS